MHNLIDASQYTDEISFSCFTVVTTTINFSYRCELACSNGMTTSTMKETRVNIFWIVMFDLLLCVVIVRLCWLLQMGLVTVNTTMKNLSTLIITLRNCRQLRYAFLLLHTTWFTLQQITQPHLSPNDKVFNSANLFSTFYFFGIFHTCNTMVTHNIWILFN